MSSVDERIVEMRFDNQQFESGVQKSLKTLDQLKSGLNLEGSAKSFESIQSSVNSLDLSGIASGVDAVSNRVSALGIVGDQVLRYLTTQFIQFGEAAAQAVKSLTTDQIGVGFDKYERKIQSVQTIMNATGMSVDDVNARLNKLNWFTDETSYSFTDMVDNISKFTSSGIKLDTAVTSMIGIADAAGLAGASVGDASHAMEGFSKAIAQGYMSRQNWQWIRTAHMDTAQFKQTLMDAAVNAGTLTKNIDKEGNATYSTLHKTAVSVADFETAMHDGWLTTEAMNEALSQFGGATEQIYDEYLKSDGMEMTSDIIARMGGRLDELGLKSFRASQEAKTFSDAINSVKDAVSTGWMTSFEYIFGNKEEATKLWTDVANEMWEVFASGGEHRNEILEEWHDSGGYQDMLDGIYNSWETIKNISSAVKEVFSDVFPGLTGEKLLGISSKFSKATKAFKDNYVVSEYYLEAFSDPKRLADFEEMYEKGILADDPKRALTAYHNIEKIKTAFGGLASIVDLAKTGLKAFGKIFAPLGKLFKVNTGGILDFAASIGEMLSNTVESIKNSETLKNIVRSLSSVVEGAVNGIKTFGGTIIAIFQKIIESEAFQKVSTKVKELASAFKEFVGENVTNAFNAILEFFTSFAETIDFDKIYKKLIEIKDAILSFLAPLVPIYNEVKGYIVKFISSLASAFAFLWGYIGSAYEAIKAFFASLKGASNPIEQIINKISNLIGKIREFKNNFIENLDLNSTWGKIISGILKVKNRIVSTLNNIGEAIKNLGLGKIIALAFGGAGLLVILNFSKALLEVSKIARSIRWVGESLSGFLDSLAFVKYASTITAIAAAIYVLVMSLSKLTELSGDLNKLKISGIAMASLLATLIGTVFAFGKLIPGKKLAELHKVGLAFISISAAIGILVQSIASIKDLTGPEIGKGIATILGLMLFISAFAAILSAANLKISKGSFEFFIGFSAGIFILVESIKRLDTLKNLDLTESLGAISLLMGLLTSFAILNRIAKSTSFGLGFSILSMSLSLLILFKFLQKIGNGSVSDLLSKAKENIIVIGIIFGALAAVALASNFSSKKGAGIGLSILAMSASLFVIYEAIKRLGKLNIGVLTKGTFAIIGVLLAFSSISKSITSNANGGKYAIKAGIGIAIMAGSMLLIQSAIKKLGEIDNSVLGKGLGSIVLIMAILGEVIKASSKEIKTGPILAMSVAIGVLVAAIAYLSMFSIGDLAKSVISLGVIMVAFGKAVNLIGQTNFEKAKPWTFIGIIAAFVGIVRALSYLKNIPWPQLLGAAGSLSLVLISLAGAIKLTQVDAFHKFNWNSVNGLVSGLLAMFAIAGILSYMSSKIESWPMLLSCAGSISTVLLAITGSMKILSFGGFNFKASITALGGVIAWIAGLSLVFGVLGYVAEKIGLDDSHVLAIERLGSLIGGFIGGVLGGLIGGAGLGMSIALPEIATNLSSFIENLQPFIDGVNEIPESFGEKLKTLGEGLIDIGKAELKDALANFINAFAGSKSGNTKDLGQNMESLGNGLKKFSISLKGIKANDLKTNMDTLKVMLESLKMIPTEGGIFDGIKSIFKGVEDFSGVIEHMDYLAEAIHRFDSGTKQIDVGHLSRIVSNMNTISSIFTSIPSFDPSGQTTVPKWSTLSDGLVEFGTAMSTFSNILTGDNAPNAAAITAAKPAVEALNDLLVSIPETDGLEQKLSGEHTWLTLGTGLKEFGEAMSAYSETVVGLNISAITNSAPAVEKLSELLKKVPEAGGDWQELFGGNYEWSVIGNGLAEFGEAMKGYSDAITSDNGLNIDAMTRSSTAISQLASILKLFKDNGLYKVSINNFGSGLADFGGYVKGMSDYLVQVDTDAITNVLSALQNLADAKSTYEELGSELAESIVTKFTLGLESANGEEMASAFITAVTVGFSNSSSRLSIIGTDAAGNVTSGVSSGLSTMFSIGAFGAQGLINGLISKVGAVRGAGYKLGVSAVSGTKVGLDSNSPSKEMRKVGVYAGEGLALGLLDMTSYVEESARKMAEDSILSVSSIFDRIDETLSEDGNLSPVITPVLDLSAVSYGANQIDGILNQDAAIRAVGQIQAAQDSQNISDLLVIGREILREIQNGRDLYLDDGVIAGRINRRLGQI